MKTYITHLSRLKPITPSTITGSIYPHKSTKAQLNRIFPEEATTFSSEQ